MNAPEAFLVTPATDHTPALQKFQAEFAKRNQGRTPLFSTASRAYAAAEVTLLAALNSTTQRRAPRPADIDGRSYSTMLGPLVLRAGGGCAAIPLAVYRLDESRTLAASTDGGECKCDDKGCCDNCDKCKECAKDSTCKHK